MVNSEGAAGPRAGAPSVPAGAMCISAHGVLVVGQNLSRAHLGAFKRCLDEVLAAPDKQMVLDFSGCLYVSSLLIGQLVDGIMRARERGLEPAGRRGIRPLVSGRGDFCLRTVGSRPQP